jgi:prepilin-type N-terminal cleavage/methylation domain-containing protein
MKNIYKRSFTLVEVMVAIAIMGLIVTGSLLYLRSNVRIYERGQKKISLQQELQLVMKYLYITIKSIGPIVYLDPKNNVILDDEYNNDYKLSKINFSELESSSGNTYVYKKLSFWKKDVFHLRHPQQMALYVEKNKGLIEEITEENGQEHKRVVSPYVKKILFLVNREDSKVLKVRVFIEKDKKEENFSLLVRLDADFLGVF